jgi:hypothetical protein
VTRLASRDRRALTIGATVIAMAALVLRGIPAARNLYAVERARASDGAERLALAREAIRTARGSADSLRLIELEWAATSGRAFAARTVNVFSAQVAGHVARATRAANVAMTSIQVRPDTAARGGFRSADGKLSARGDVRGLATLLATLEWGSKRFRIKSLTVTQADPIGRIDAPEQLSMELAFSTVAIEGEQPGPSPATRAVPVDSLHRSRANTIVAGNPIRITRTPAPIAFALDSQPMRRVAAAAPAVSRAVLILRGIVGPPWSALIEGIPGTAAATVVKAGDRFGDLHVVTIRKDSVIVRGSDTTWRLAVSRTWR